MKHLLSYWKALGLVAGTLLLGAGLQAQTSVPNVTLLATDPRALAGTSTGAFTLIRDGDTNDSLTVDVDISGTASNGVDYSTISTSLVIPPGFLAIDVPVQPIVDTANRGNKTVVLTVERSAAYHISGFGKATVKIVDDIFDIPPPTVSITSPADGSVFTAPATFTLQADISDPQLPIRSVSFFSGDDLIGRDTTAPYTLTQKKLAPGTYTFFVRAEDQFGKSAVSEPITVTVASGPVVTLTAPNGTTTFPGEITPLQATFADTNEAISSVNFFLGNKSIGTVTSAPFVLNWTPTATGEFSFHAVATDKNSGKKGTSQTLEIVVTDGGGQ